MGKVIHVERTRVGTRLAASLLVVVIATLVSAASAGAPHSTPHW
jgi:hypothetical protein